MLSCPTCLVPNVLLYLTCLMPYVLLSSTCSRASRASLASCLSGLVLYVPRALQNLLPNNLYCSACLISYVLSCRTCLISFVLSFLMCLVPCLLLCLTWLVPCVFSWALCPMCLHPFWALFSYVILVPRTFSILCANINICVLELPCLTLLYLRSFPTCEFFEEITQVRTIWTDKQH